jgi:predicted DNA-binding transcriptional regulator AlpA
MFAIALEAPAKKPLAKPRARVSAPKRRAPKKRVVKVVESAKDTAPCAVLRVQDAALHVGLSVSTLNKMRGDGRGPCFIKLTHKVVGYAVDDLDAWLMSRRDSASR